MGSNTGSYIGRSSNMNRVKATACNPNDMDYFCEKNSISQCEKKCLAFRGSLQEIDRLVYRLYDLTEEEIQVMEGI